MIKRLDLGKEAIFPLILKMSWPSIIAMTAMSVYNFIDTFWLARLSSQALAALTVCFPIQIIFAAVGVGTGIGAGSFSARMFGAGQTLPAKKTAGQIFFLSFFFGLIMILSVLFFGDVILISFGAFKEIMPLCHDYLYIIVFSSPFLFFSMMSNNLLRAEGRPLLSMYVVLIASFASAIFDPFLIFGIGPFPRLGIKGAALSAVIAQIIACTFSICFMQLKSSKYELKWAYIIPDFSIIKSIYSTGLPSIVINLIVSLVLVIYNHVLANFGFMAIAALGICFRVTGLASMVLFGIGFGLMPIVAFSEGARLYQRLKESVFVALKVALIFAAAALIFLEIFAPQIVGLFSNDPSLTVIATPALRIHTAALVLIAPIMIFINMFMGLGKGTLAMFLLLFRDSIAFIPLLIILPFCFGLSGAWMALPLANLIALFAVLHWTKKELRRLERS
ncbi:MAG: MATE family efflux transporter [Deltaproteobacteria bacterium HGW-Deltaproteobacteria-7]|jgi:putative MATE family efflux protein|nr:MAG: MATE family efflux transporter [Deltaproteobacteria bacterium HGW-Deltaproteobacteria-7]PKN52242.1 MAG: MATE family efflux transporter [Deltaproteobacteria bacterium HGW-Deltaproteobacteria-13]